MAKAGDSAVIYCSKCKVETPHTYKTSTIGDISKKLIKSFKDIGSGWYCNNCGKKNFLESEDYKDEEEYLNYNSSQDVGDKKSKSYEEFEF